MSTTRELTDRELDALIAEKVFGQCLHSWEETYRRNLRIGWCCAKCGKKSISGMLAGAPFVEASNYSTTGDGMLAVLAAMERRGWHAKIKTPFAPGEPAFAGFTPHNVTGWNGRPDFFVSAGSVGVLPRAVALAALRALGEDV
jgi:hypothetical protein